MNTLKEAQLQIEFSDAITAIKFDQYDKMHQDFHDLENMPRVDFVVEMANEIYFIELKDPGQPGAADVGGKSFLKKVIDGTLEASLIEKYLYTFFFRWAENKLNKSVHYICLITIDSPELQPISERLDTRLAELMKKSSRWVRRPLLSCQVHNIETWAVMFPNWPLKRLTTSPLGA